MSAEPGLPLDRPELSKGYLSGGQAGRRPAAPARRLVRRARGRDPPRASPRPRLDLAERFVTLADGTTLAYDALVLATGAEPVRPDLPGLDRADAYVLRTQEDADAIVAASDGRRVVVVGSGFIGLEVAAALRQRELDVTVVAPGAVPMARQLGEDLGRVLRTLHEENGTRFVEGRAAAWDGHALVLEDGTRVEADVLVVGLGVEPRTGLAEAAGLAVDDGVLVDATFETSVRGVFAVGDIARYPDPLTGRLVRVEHWAQAERSGALAAVNLLGGQQAITEPAFYWTQQLGKSFRVSGHAESLDDGHADGSAADQQLLVTFREDGRVVAAAGLGRDHDLLVTEDVELRQPAR